jgi:hypothetical protein
MSASTGMWSVVASLAALGLAGYAAFGRVAPAAVPDARVDVLEGQVARLTKLVEQRTSTAPGLRGVGGGREGGVVEAPPPLAGTPPAAASAAGRAGGASAVAARGPDGELLVGEAGADVQALVDAAVEKRTQQVVQDLKLKEDKKPLIETFASALELTDDQRHRTEQEIVRGQREMLDVLATPTWDGSVLLDELVETFAQSMAAPGKDAGRMMRLFGKLLTEKVPGTDETYGARIDAIKRSVKDTLRTVWQPEQYAEFEAWGVDPLEVKNVPGTPNAAIERRVLDRARDLGVELPEDGPR